MSFKRLILFGVCYAMMSIAALVLYFDGSAGNSFLWLSLSIPTGVAAIYHFYQANLWKRQDVDWFAETATGTGRRRRWTRRHGSLPRATSVASQGRWFRAGTC